MFSRYDQKTKNDSGKCGIQTNIGNLNRDIKAANQMLSAIRKTIRDLLDWIEELVRAEEELLKEEAAAISERRNRAIGPDPVSRRAT